jgi:type II restriction enzyme
MARKADLRLQRAGTVINLTSKQQETALGKALKKVVARLQADFGLQLHHTKTAKLADILNGLEADFPEVPFGHVRPDTSMKPDGEHHALCLLWVWLRFCKRQQHLG